MTKPEWVLQNIELGTWSSQDGAAYEVALEGINHVVGAYSRLIAEAETAADAKRVESLTAEQRRWSARRVTLTPADRAEVDAVAVECSRLLAELRGRA
ncbi:hypothetical protein ACFY30_37450 [Streptomyces sp. NPDC000345]|uniref:hypothetical protein n=1 Tax=Streptomyces sp. NPDC000345 TaxID=3364537 RepID=UPI0036920EBA